MTRVTAKKAEPAMKVTLEDLEPMTRGAAFLGAGGGGDPYLGGLVARAAIEKYGPPAVIDVADVPDDALLITIAGMGAPTVMVEKTLSVEAAMIAFDALEKHIGKKVFAVLPVEMGGLNSMVPIALAARRGLAVIDADGMGRAFPEIQMVTYHVYGVSTTPMVISNEHHDCILIETRDGKRAEDIGRAIATQMGLNVMLASYPMTGRQAKQSAVKGTLSLARGIGRAIAEVRRKGDPVEVLLGYLRTTPYYNKCAVLFDGKVTDLRRETTRGFAIGHCKMAALDGSGDELEVTFQNEHLVARVNGATRTIVPDLVCFVDRETGEPITTEGLRYGQRAKVIGTSVAPNMRTPEALAVFGPKGFGMDEPFQPIEDLMEIKP